MTLYHVIESRLCQVQVYLSHRLELLSYRSDRARQESGLARDLAGVARDFDRLAVDLADLAFEPVPGEPDPVGAKCVGLDHLRAGGEVGPVDLFDDPRLGQVELVEAALERHTARMELGAHGTIAEDCAALDSLEERVEGLRSRHESVSYWVLRGCGW